MNMLCDYFLSDVTKTYFENMFNGLGYSIKDISHGVKDITTSIWLQHKERELHVGLSEFPGNCSSIILHKIQSAYRNHGEEVLKNVVKMAIEICLKFNYGALFISTTDENLMSILISHYGFECVTEQYNPHSTNTNYFMKLNIVEYKKKIKQEEVEKETPK